MSRYHHLSDEALEASMRSLAADLLEMERDLYARRHAATCPGCGKSYLRRRKGQRCCSSRCSLKLHSKEYDARYRNKKKLARLLEGMSNELRSNSDL